jgi:hypothetical protein
VISWGYDSAPVYLHYDHINVFFTLFFGAAAIYAFDLIAERFKSAGEWYGRAAGLTAGVGICWLAGPLHTDYGFHGALVILIIYVVMTFINNRFLRIAPLVVWALWTYRYSEQYAAFAMTAPLLIILYDGTQGPKWVKSVKMFFYVYYPLHLTVVYWFSTALA